MPTPRTDESVTLTPSARMQSAVDFTSAPALRPRRVLLPSAIDPRIRARCEIDLSPGTLTSPSSWRAFLTVAITWRLPLPLGERVGERGVSWQRRLTSAREPHALPRRARRAEDHRPRGGDAIA